MSKELTTIFANSEEIKSLIGINFALNGQHGMNCYGAVRKVYDHLNIKLPDRDELILNKEYIEAEGNNWIRIERPEHLCVAIIDHGHTLHLGIVLLEREGSSTFKLLHALPNKGVVCADLKRYEKRIIAFAKYKEGEGDFTLPSAQGGDTGRAIGGLLIAVMASVIPGAGFLALTGMQAVFASIAITVVGSILLNKFFPLKQPEVPQISGFSGELQESKTYTFSGISNVRNQGNIKPILIGTMRTGGQIVSETIWADIDSDEYLDVLVTPVKGLISHIGTTYLNDTNLQHYPNTYLDIRYGQDEQKLMQFFNPIFKQYQLSSIIPYCRTSEVDQKALIVPIKDTVNKDSVRFSIVAPNGVYALDENNLPLSKSVKFRIEGYYDYGFGSQWYDALYPYSSGEKSAVIRRTSGVFQAWGGPEVLVDVNPGGDGFAMTFYDKINVGQDFIMYVQTGTLLLYCTEASNVGERWQASHGYIYRDKIVTNSGHIFINLVNGTFVSGTAEPDWDTALEPGATIVDGAVTWTEYSCVLVFNAFTDSARTVPYGGTPTDGAYYIVSGDYDDMNFTLINSGLYQIAFSTNFDKTHPVTRWFARRLRFTMRLCGAVDAVNNFYYGYAQVWYKEDVSGTWLLFNTYTVGSEDVTTDFFKYQDFFVDIPVPRDVNYDIKITYGVSGNPGVPGVGYSVIQISDLECVCGYSTPFTPTPPAIEITLTGDTNNPTKSLIKNIWYDTNLMTDLTQFRIYRVTPETSSQYSQDKIYIRNYAEGYSEDFGFTYPNHVLLGLRIKATDRLSGSQPEISSVLTGGPLALPAPGDRVDTTINAVAAMSLNVGLIVRGTLVDGLTRIRVNTGITDPPDTPGLQTRGFIVLTEAAYDGYAGVDQLLTKPFFRIATWKDFTTYTYLYVEADDSFFVPTETVTIFTHAVSPADSFAWAVAKMLIDGSTGKITENMINWSTFDAWNIWNELNTSWKATSPEQRNRLNGVIDYQGDLWSIVQQTAGYGRAFIVPTNGKYEAVVDKADSIVQIFSDGNCSNVDWDFIPKRDRANVIIASFLNEENNYEEKTISAEDIQGNEVPNIANIGMMVGVTKESQVLRHLNYILLQNRYLSSTLNFDVGPQNIEMKVGNVFGFQSKVLNNQVGGRLTFDDDGVTEDSDTKILIHGDGVGETSGIQDECGNVFTNTLPLQLTYSHIKYKFGNSSIYTLNTGYLTTPYSSDFTPDTNDFCFDYWMHHSVGFGSWIVPLQHYLDGDNHAQFGFNSTSKQFLFKIRVGAVDQATYYYTFASWVPATWYHVAITWDGATLRLFIDGTQIVWTTVSVAYTGTWGVINTPLGMLQAAGSDKYYCDEVRFVNGAAKYTSNFTPPTTPYKVNQVILDQEVVPENDETYSLKIWDSTNDIREWQSKIGQATKTLPAPSGFVTTGRYECAYKIAIVGSAYTEFRCLAIKRKTKSFKATIHGIEYRTEIYPND